MSSEQTETADGNTTVSYGPFEMVQMIHEMTGAMRDLGDLPLRVLSSPEHYRREQNLANMNQVVEHMLKRLDRMKVRDDEPTTDS